MKIKFIKNERGQVMVLGSLGVLLVALMMLLTLNVGKAVYEKIRIQQLADAAAFSDATLAARSFNFFAYTNRANISGLAAAASAHGFMSLASSVPGMFMAARRNFLAIAGIEFIICIATRNPQHCRHGIRDLRIARRYGRKGRELANEVKELDDAFIDVIESLDRHIKFIALQQTGMKTWMLMKYMNNDTAQKLIDKFSPGTDRLSHVGLLNVASYTSVFENDETKRKWLGTEIANGTRWKRFVYNRGVGTVWAGVFPTTLLDLINRIPGSAGISLPISHQGEARIIKGATGVEGKVSRKNHGPDGDAAGSVDKGRIFSMTFSCPIPWISSYKATLGSNSGGEHKCSPSVSCCNNESKHAGTFTCLGDDGEAIHNCFTVFKSNDKPDEDFGQPRFYAGLSSDLRRTQGQGQKMAWEVTDNESGKVKVDFGDIHNKVRQELGGTGGKEIQLTDNPDEFGEGLAVSKAMVYYHHPDWGNRQSGWKEAPNFFNPYWKAKLQPFKNGIEITLALGPAAAKYGAVVNIPGVPLP